MSYNTERKKYIIGPIWIPSSPSETVTGRPVRDGSCFLCSSTLQGLCPVLKMLQWLLVAESVWRGASCLGWGAPSVGVGWGGSLLLFYTVTGISVKRAWRASPVIIFSMCSHCKQQQQQQLCVWGLFQMISIVVYSFVYFFIVIVSFLYLFFNGFVMFFLLLNLLAKTGSSKYKTVKTKQLKRKRKDKWINKKAEIYKCMIYDF